MDYLAIQAKYCTPTWQPAGAGNTILFQLASMLLIELILVLECDYKRLADLITTLNQKTTKMNGEFSVKVYVCML